MSNWGRSPRGGNGMETAQALNVWRETCAQEKEHRRASLSKLGLKAPVHQPPAKGTVRSDPPLRYSYLFASPRATTAQEAALMHKQPGALPIRYLIPGPDDPVDKTYNRKKSEFDYSDDSRGDHEIFPRDHRDVGRKKIRDLKAQVPPLLGMAQWHEASRPMPRPVWRARARRCHMKSRPGATRNGGFSGTRSLGATSRCPRLAWRRWPSPRRRPRSCIPECSRRGACRRGLPGSRRWRYQSAASCPCGR